MAIDVARRRFTVEAYHRMGKAGILREDDRVELLDGEIVEMTPIGRRHAACVNRLNHPRQRAIGDRAIVRVQNPVTIAPHSEPQPDLMLLRPQADFCAARHPEPRDVLLVIEVAEPGGGRYGAVERRRRGERIAYQAFPEVQLPVDDVLGSPA